MYIAIAVAYCVFLLENKRYGCSCVDEGFMVSLKTYFACMLSAILWPLSLPILISDIIDGKYGKPRKENDDGN